MEVLSAEDVPECGLCQEPGGVVGILHVSDGYGGVGDSVVDHRVHGHCHGVPGQHLGVDTRVSGGGVV